MRYLQIINIDGTKGCGKSTQIGLLRNHFKDIGFEVQVNDVRDIESAYSSNKNIVNFLESTQNGIVINNGSIARPIVSDLVSGLQKEEIIDKYRESIFQNDTLYFKYGVANILLVLDNLEEANRRLAKRSKIMGLETEQIENLDLEQGIVNGMLHFDDHVISKNIEFRYIEIKPEDSMLDVKENILEYIENHYEIKKP